MANYILHFRALEHEAPEAIRLRRLLKDALRRYAFRCTDFRIANADAQGERSEARRGDETLKGGIVRQRANGGDSAGLFNVSES